MIFDPLRMFPTISVQFLKFHFIHVVVSGCMAAFTNLLSFSFKGIAEKTEGKDDGKRK